MHNRLIAVKSSLPAYSALRHMFAGAYRSVYEAQLKRAMEAIERAAPESLASKSVPPAHEHLREARDALTSFVKIADEDVPRPDGRHARYSRAVSMRSIRWTP